MLRLALVRQLDMDTPQAAEELSGAAGREPHSPEARPASGRLESGWRTRVSEVRRPVRAPVRLCVDLESVGGAVRLEGSGRGEMGGQHGAACDVGVIRDGD